MRIPARKGPLAIRLQFMGRLWLKSESKELLAGFSHHHPAFGESTSVL